MDRRYKETRLNGVTASNSRRERSDSLVRSYLGQARRAYHSAQAYGGSSGGISSANVGLGASVLAERSAQMGRDRAIFRESGSGALGGRRSFAQARELPRMS